MKLRVRGDSLRLRLTRAEVAALGRDGVVEESISFGPDRRLTYAIRAAADATATVAALDGARIEVRLPSVEVRRWIDSELVGLESTQDSGEGRTLRVLVEKDFACLKDRPHEDDADAFSSPDARR